LTVSRPFGDAAHRWKRISRPTNPTGTYFRVRLVAVGSLSDPRRHDLDPAIVFHLVIPSLPGFDGPGGLKRLSAHSPAPKEEVP
jgi:hypothetical protein